MLLAGADTARTAAWSVAPVEPKAWRGGVLGSRWNSPSARLGLFALAAVMSALFLHNPVLLLVGIVAALTTVLLQRLGAFALPASVLALVLAASLIGTAAGLLDVNLLGYPILTTISALIMTCGAAIRGLLSDHGAGSPGTFRERSVARAAYFPPTLMAGIGVAQSLFPWLSTRWDLVGTDLIAHANLLGSVQTTGRLDYAASSYPRGLHMLLALTAMPGDPAAHTAALLRHDLQLFAAVIWLTAAVLAWTGAAVTIKLGDALQLNPATSRRAASVLTWTLLLALSFQRAFLVMGAASSLLAVLALWMLPTSLVIIRRPSARTLLLVTAASTALLANLWQALVLGPLTGLAFVGAGYVWRWRRDGAGAMRRILRLAPWIRMCAIYPILAGAAIPLIAVERDGGVALAAIPGGIPRIPVLAGLAAILGLLMLLKQARMNDFCRAWLGTVLGLITITGYFLLAAGAGVGITSYYPMKSLWFALLFIAPFAALAATRGCEVALRFGWGLAARLPASTRLMRGGVVAIAVASVLALAIPGALSAGSAVKQGLGLTSPDPAVERRLDVAVRFGKSNPGVILVPSAVALQNSTSQYGAYVTSKLLSFQTGQRENFGLLELVCEDLSTVAAGKRAVVLTDLPVPVMKQVMERRGCGNVPVLQAPGADPRILETWTAALAAARANYLSKQQR